MTTRLYFNFDVSLAPEIEGEVYGSGWQHVGTSNGYRYCMTPNRAEGITDTGWWPHVVSVAGQASGDYHGRQIFVLPPLYGSGTISGTVKGRMRCAEREGGANFNPAIALRLVSSTGTIKATLLPPTAGSATGGAAPEAPVDAAMEALTNRQLPYGSPKTLTPAAFVEGDRIQVEIGGRFMAADAAGGTYAARLASGVLLTGQADLPEDDSTTTDLLPWLEFSQDLPLTPPTVPPGAQAPFGPRMEDHMKILYANDWSAPRRMLYVVLKNTDNTPATGEAGNKVKLSKNGGTAGDSTNSLVAVVSARGLYKLQLEVGDYDAGSLYTYYEKAGLQPWEADCAVQPCPDLWAGTASGGGSNYVDLPVGAPSRIDAGTVVQLLVNTGSPAMAVVASYASDTRRVTVDEAWAVAPDATTKLVLLVGPPPVAEVSADIVKLAGSADAATTLAKMARAGRGGTVGSGTITTTSFPTDVTVLDANCFAGKWLYFISGNCADQCKQILANTVAGLFTVDGGFSRAPAVGDEFAIV